MRQQSEKHKTAGAVCIAVLSCILAAECTMLVMQYRSRPHGTLCASGNQRVTDAKAEYLMHSRGSAAPERLTDTLQKELAAAMEAYRAGTASYPETAAEIRSLLALGNATLTGEAERCLAEAEKTEAARQAFAAAQTAEQNGNDAEAIRQYRLVTNDDPECFQKVKQALPLAEARLRDAALAEADSLDTAADYAAEITGLEQALAVLPDDSEILSAYTQAVTRRTYTVRHSAMRQARISADQGTYSAAFAALAEGISEMPDDPLLQFAQQNLAARYLLFVQEHTVELADQGKTADAAALLAEAESLLPESAALQAVRQTLAAYQPQKLALTEAGEQNEFFRAEQALTDRSGKEYPADGNLFCSFDGAMTGRRSSSGTFLLNGQYSLLTLTAAPLASYTAENSVILEIYGDDRLLSSYPFDKDSAALHIRTDITGVQTLRLRVYPIGVPDLQNAGILIADAAVRKAGDAS